MATDEGGRKVWQRNLDTRGNPLQKTDNFVPFLYQGQYFDDETGLAYNRFRYYSPSEGTFISQDPIGLAGEMPNLYAYVADSNAWVDPLGLAILPTLITGSRGETLSATATITQADLGTGTNTNASSRTYARSMGNQTDDAGHIIGKQLGGSGGKKNVFAQNLSVNRGRFAMFEGVVTDMVHAKGDVKITVEFEYKKGGKRPTDIHYTAESADGTIKKQSFKNPCN